MSGEELVPIARAAIAEITDPADAGDLIAADQPAEGVVDLRFAALMPGYPGWAWTVSIAVVEGVDPTVLELELLPGDDALLAPAWVPWAERLADWRRSHADDTVSDEDDSDDDEADEDDDFDDELDEDALEGDPDDVLDDGIEVDEVVAPDPEDDGAEDADDEGDPEDEHLREP